MIRLTFLDCRAVRRDLWDYAGERMAEGPMEQVERHLETCAVCRKEALKWRRAQNLLAAAPSEPLPKARLGWNDLQARIAADVAAFGPPRPDKERARQAVSQLMRPRRSFVLPEMSALRPALAGGMAFALALVLFTHRPLPTPQNPAPPAASAAIATLPVMPAPESNLDNLADAFPGALSLMDAPAKEPRNPQADAAKAPAAPAPRRTEARPTAAPSAHSAKAFRPKNAPVVSPSKRMLANAAQNPKDTNKIKFTPRDPAATTKAPDGFEVAQGVIGALVPVSRDDNDVY